MKTLKWSLKGLSSWAVSDQMPSPSSRTWTLGPVQVSRSGESGAHLWWRVTTMVVKQRIIIRLSPPLTLVHTGAVARVGEVDQHLAPRWSDVLKREFGWLWLFCHLMFLQKFLIFRINLEGINCTNVIQIESINSLPRDMTIFETFDMKINNVSVWNKVLIMFCFMF